ncbi:NAD-dependent epimerase/dehydratase family protein [Micromonospora globbae]|uniref:NAD-dependent epimerase/dehydratase family protein n=1 Tax=Micromonospora globbae TaxID=1894969 RepID=UPI003432F851
MRSTEIGHERTGTDDDRGGTGDGIQGRRLLILGGTWFLGRTLAETALSMGWKVTCFNRGRTGRDVPGTETVRGDRANPEDVRRLAERGPWDAVVDTSVYEPPDALLMARALHPVASRYVLISTVSAYRHWPHEPVDEASPLWPSRPDARESDADIAAMPGPYAYGTLKAGCEQAVHEVYGDMALILRPGVVLGPYEYVGRLQTLLGRAARGGKMLAAGDPDQPIQPVDVRDLTDFTLSLIRDGVTGEFNVAAPHGHATYGDLLTACAQATGSAAHLVWVEAAWLADQDVRQWTEIPLWRTPAGTWAVDASRARDAGLVCRPLLATVTDTWRWLQAEQPVPHERQAEHGLDPAKEARLLTAWEAQQALR